MKSTSELFKEHVDKLVSLAERDDDSDETLDARRSLACLSLLAEGWRYGDPDPVDPDPDPDDKEPIPFPRRVADRVLWTSVVLKRAA